MNKIQKVTSPILIVANVMLVFLFLFESKVELPLALNPVGRLHPLVLHLPIGVFFVAIGLQFAKELFSEIDLREILKFLFLSAAVLSVFTALFGFFLGQEAGYGIEELKYHKWLGILTSLASWLCFLAIDRGWIFGKYLNIFTAIILIVTGHLGGEITHGENYILASFQEDKKMDFDPNEPILDEAIFPILDSKCLSCHNDKKTKGELNMSSLTKLLEGGENGPIWVPGDIEKSHLIQNLLLPLEDKEHMPPKGKPQLNNLEISILSEWIRQGANTEITLSDLSDSDTLRGFILQQYPSESTKNTYEFKSANAGLIIDMNTPFCTVEQIALGSPALKANFYVRERFDVATLRNLEKVSEQLVELNLAKMPISDKEIQLLSKFPNLEKLVLNNTEITGGNLSELKRLAKLNSLSLSGCSLNEESLSQLNDFPSLTTLYVWDTDLKEDDLEGFENANPEVMVSRGFIPTEGDMLKINPPLAVNKSMVLKEGEKAQLKHSLNDVTIRYSFGEESLDSISGMVYENEIPFDGFVKVQALATKDGWFASDKKPFSFYRSGFQIGKAELLTQTDPQYPGKGIATLIDRKQGDKSNFKDFAWLGFKGGNAEILLELENGQDVNGITVSYLKSSSSFIMPPTEVEIWVGESKGSLKLLEKKKGVVLKKNEAPDYDGISFPIKSGYKFIKIVAKPLQRLPKWHAGSGQRAWLFLDEIYAY